MEIKTTHVGSLPRPAAMQTQILKKETITHGDLNTYLADILEQQMALGLSYINNGELPRADYVSATVARIAGFDATGVAPIPKDMEELPEYSRRFGGRNGLITLNPKAPVKLPACSRPLAYVGEAALRQELEMMVRAHSELKKKYPQSESQLFFTAPSPGTVALFLENNYYPNYQAYVAAVGEVLRREYEIISSYGVLLQVDCPDLAMGRHTRFRQMKEDQFLEVIDINVRVLNQALANIDGRSCRAHICWGNYAGTHHCDIELSHIFEPIMRVAPKYISLESSNHRHAHEWEVFKRFIFPEEKVLMPGVIDTTSTIVEHPQLVAQRILTFARILGPERVVASTDCGFASTASAASVSGEVAWLKLQAMVEGARLASRQ
ncbi:MAG: cobalamin-independent methionine synthase II family protein [Desulfobacteraceae bacterium]|nr:cobalamin-independent methionine synthase II family protein [Desulfobacteraceae bacterium]